MRKLFFAIVFVALSVGAAAQPARKLQYHPDGRGLVSCAGQNRYPCALYGGNTDFRMESQRLQAMLAWVFRVTTVNAENKHYSE